MKREDLFLDLLPSGGPQLGPPGILGEAYPPPKGILPSLTVSSRPPSFSKGMTQLPLPEGEGLLSTSTLTGEGGHAGDLIILS